MEIADIEGLIRDIPDFPEPGVLFKDITPVLAQPEALAALVESLSAPFLDQPVDLVAGIEARGFILATPVARRLGAGFIPLRKPGKLPYDVVSESYSLEYGIDTLEMHEDAVHEGARVLIVDDVIATGGTGAAAVRLLNRGGADVVGVSVFIDLAFLGGRTQLGDVPFHATVTYD